MDSVTSRLAPKFADLALSEPLQQVMRELDFTALTPIQAEAIPALLAGEDFVGQSRTGSGKTLAFSLPILERLRLERRRVQALVLCPTRELCAQVAREMRKLGRRHPGLQVLVLSGGMPSGPQRAALEKGVHIVVGTPGRVLDMLTRHKLSLDWVRCVVLDEADRMLDMGFQPDIEQILGYSPCERQTVFFSATFPASIAGMSEIYQKDPRHVRIDEDQMSEKPSIEQRRLDTAPSDKFEALAQLLADESPEAAIVFCNHIATTSELAQSLAALGMSAAALHGSLDQYERDLVLARFRNRSVRILVATDVAARGLDVAGVDLVVNFDLPRQADVYVHRIGRTGRAGRSGLAISLVTPADRERLANIEASQAHMLGFYEPSREAEQSPASGPSPSLPAQLAAMETLRIFGGRKDKVRPGDILGALTGEAGGLHANQIGKIEIHDHFAFVAIATDAAQTALRGLMAGRIKGRRFQVEMVR